MLLIKDIPAIEDGSTQISNVEDLSSICELPVLEACKIFFTSNIRTIMSSGNKKNVSLSNKSRPMYSKEKIPDINDFSYGYGYAWIMLDYDSLSTQNKELVNSLCSEENCDIVGDLNGTAKELFFQRCKVDNVFPADNQLVQLCIVPGRNCRLCTETRRYPPDYVALQKKAFESLEKNPRPLDRSYIDFYSKATLLFTTPYKERVVILRYPVGEQTTVEEVSDYFVKLTSRFYNNSLIKVPSKTN